MITPFLVPVNLTGGTIMDLNLLHQYIFRNLYEEKEKDMIVIVSNKLQGI